MLSNWATAGVTCPSEKGKVAIFDISIMYIKAVVFAGFGGNSSVADFPLLEISCLYTLSIFLSSSVYNKYCSDNEIGVKISLASSAHLNQAD